MNTADDTIGKTFIASISNRKLWISLAIGLVLMTVIFLQVPLDHLATGIATVSVPLFLAALPCRLASNLVRTVRFGYFFPSGGKMLRLFGSIAAGRLADYVVPLGVPAGGKIMQLFGTFALIRVTNYVVPFRLGEIVSVVLLKRLGFAPSVAETAPIWIFFRLCDFLGLALIAAAVMLIAALPVGVEQQMTVAVSVMLAAFAIIIAAVPPVVRSVEGATWIRRRAWIRNRFDAIQAGLQRIKSVKAFAIALSAAILIWASNITGSVLAMFAFGAPLTVGQATLVAILVTLTGLLPIRPPLGLGVTDVLWAAMLGLFGVPLDQAIVISIGMRLAVTAAVLLDGAISAIILVPARIAKPVPEPPPIE